MSIGSNIPPNVKSFYHAIAANKHHWGSSIFYEYKVIELEGDLDMIPGNHSDIGLGMYSHKLMIQKAIEAWGTYLIAAFEVISYTSITLMLRV